MKRSNQSALKRRTPLLVAAGVIHKSGEILVGQRRLGDRHALKWEFPGGKVEEGETPRQGLVRELREELQIEAEIGAELARYEFDYPSGSQVHLFFFVVLGFNGVPVSHAFEQIVWTALPDLPKLDFLEGDVDFVRRLAKGEYSEHLPG